MNCVPVHPVHFKRETLVVENFKLLENFYTKFIRTKPLAPSSQSYSKHENPVKPDKIHDDVGWKLIRYLSHFRERALLKETHFHLHISPDFINKLENSLNFGQF